MVRCHGSNYEIYCDGLYWRTCNINVINQCEIKIGNRYLESNLIEKILSFEIKQSKEKAFLLLSIRDYSRYELAKKLRFQFSENAVIYVCNYLESQGYLNDYNYATKLLDYFFNNKIYSIARVRQELSKKGIKRELIDTILDNTTVNVKANIKRLILKKYTKYLVKDKRKIITSLINLGYSYYDISYVLENDFNI